MNLLDELLEQYNTDYEDIENQLLNNKDHVMKWIKNGHCYYILSPSVKEAGYQLTHFIDDVPTSDLIRKTINHKDIINELIQNEANIDEIF